MIFEELSVLYEQEPHPAALNMAIDEVLLRKIDAPLLRLYRWSRPSVSFGYFGKFDEVREAWPSRDWVRRWTGGGIVPHGEDVTYSVIVPRRDPFAHLNPLESYERIHKAVAAALAAAGENVQLAAAASHKVSEACFENPCQHDIIASGQKVAGAAQRRTQFGLLHQGSIQANGVSEKTRERLAEVMSSRLLTYSLSMEDIKAAKSLAAEKYECEEWLKRF